MSNTAGPEQPATRFAEPVPEPKPESRGLKALAWVWLVVSILAGLSFINGTFDVTYGGDAFTGIQNAVARVARAVGFVIIGTGVLTFVTVFRKNSPAQPR